MIVHENRVAGFIMIRKPGHHGFHFFNSDRISQKPARLHRRLCQIQNNQHNGSIFEPYKPPFLAPQPLKENSDGNIEVENTIEQ